MCTVYKSGMATRVPLEEATTETPGYRSPPSNLEAEQALLGALLVNNEAASLVSAFLLPEHFFLPVHGRIYDAVLRMIERGQIANPVTLKHYFERDEALEEAGGGRYLARLAGSAVTVINAEHYGRAIHDLAMRRALVSIGEEVVNDAYDGPLDQPASVQIEEAEHRLYQLAEDGRVDPGGQQFAAPLASAVEMIEQAYKRDRPLTGAPTGFVDLDRLLGGLHASDLIILAGRPGMGKTALATNIAFNAATRFSAGGEGPDGTGPPDGAKVAFFSLEMSAEQLATRILAEQTEISSDRLRRGEVRDTDFDRIVRACRTMEDLPLFIDDSPALTIAGLRARARRLKRRHGVSMIVVDYLQLMRPTTSMRLNNRVQEVSEVTQGLKALAKDLDLPVLALAQLSRAVEQRDDKRPQLADLRESGSIEQDADVVMFIYREQYYLARKEPEEGTADHAEWQEKMDKVHNKAEIIIAKQRHGPIGKLELYFNALLTKFDNLDKIHEPADDPPF